MAHEHDVLEASAQRISSMICELCKHLVEEYGCSQNNDDTK